MTNARKELEGLFRRAGKPTAMAIRLVTKASHHYSAAELDALPLEDGRRPDYGPAVALAVSLRMGHGPEDLEKALSLLDVEYDQGYGMQYLQGGVWFADGTWADRGEYDGSEWWNHHKRPEIPPELS